MLKGISPLLSPDLLKMLCEMGHGDEILLADAHFPGHTLGKHVLRADGLTIPQLLDAILPMLVLDEHANPLIMMQPDAGDSADPTVEADFLSAARRLAPEVSAIIRIPRPAFYDRAKSAYAVVITGELRAYGNLILRKGVTPIVK